MYKLFPDLWDGSKLNTIKRISDGACIPFDERNTDYQVYLRWLDGYESINGEWVRTNPDGNTPLPADSE
jgi:hypothetical protein